jgi:hypothetical protein
MENKDLPSSDQLLPGSAPFANHPGYDAAGCPLREVVVARTSVTNNGFRCHMTGGHCLPGEHCESRRKRAADLQRQERQNADPLEGGFDPHYYGYMD